MHCYNKQLTIIFLPFFLLCIFIEEVSSMNTESENSMLHHRTLVDVTSDSERVEQPSSIIVNVNSLSTDDYIYERFLETHSQLDIEEHKYTKRHCSVCKSKQVCAVAMVHGCCYGGIGTGIGYGLGKAIEVISQAMPVSFTPTVSTASTSTGLITPTAFANTLSTIIPSAGGMTQTTAITMGCCGVTCCLLSSSFSYFYNWLDAKQERSRKIQQRMESLFLSRQSLLNNEEQELFDLPINRPVVTTQPQTAASLPGPSNEQGRGSPFDTSSRASSGTIYETVSFLPGYNQGGQLSSLQSMQCILAGPSEQVSTTLKMLTIKAHELPEESTNTLQLQHVKHLQGPHRLLKASRSSEKPHQGISSCRMFAFSDSYVSNLEKKVRSGRAGLVTELAPGMILGLAYTRHNDGVKSIEGVQLGTGSGSVKSKTEAEALSAVIALNPEKKGLTGHVTSYHGWGKMKTSRSFTHAGSEATAKGKPDIYLSGGLIQFGYNIVLSSTTTIVPYVEGMMSMVHWDTYKERSGLLPCSISRSEETVVEKSIGLSHHLKLSSGIQLQSWVAGISGQRKTDAISCRPVVLPVKRYEAYVPVQERAYIQTELGISYSMLVTDSLRLGLDGMMRIDKLQKVKGKTMTLSLQYVY